MVQFHNPSLCTTRFISLFHSIKVCKFKTKGNFTTSGNKVHHTMEVRCRQLVSSWALGLQMPFDFSCG